MEDNRRPCWRSLRKTALTFDDVLVRKVVETVRVESAEKLEVTVLRMGTERWCLCWKGGWKGG